MLSQYQINKIKKWSGNDHLSGIFSVLGDKTRYGIVKLLARNKELCVSDLSAILGMSLSCISQHLRILEMSGIVESRRNGKSICYRQKLDKTMKSLVALM